MARRPGARCGTRFRVAERGSAAVRSGGPCSAVAAMSSDFESYEQDFAVLTAEITGRIGKVPKLVGGERLLFSPAALAPQARPARLKEPLQLPAVGAQGGGGRCRRGFSEVSAFPHLCVSPRSLRSTVTSLPRVCPGGELRCWECVDRIFICWSPVRISSSLLPGSGAMRSCASAPEWLSRAGGGCSLYHHCC